MDTKETVRKIKYLLDIVPAKILSIPEADVSYRRAPGKWSKREILGHLCDSAINNLSRFVKAQFEPKPFGVEGYDQDEWVKAGHYQEMETEEVLSFWKAANVNIINVISNYNIEQLSYECFSKKDEFGNYLAREKPEYTSANGKRTLIWLIDDYGAHMEYHLHQIIDY